MTATNGNITAPANRIHRKVPCTKIMLRKQAARMLMVMVYWRIRADISSLVAMRASVISGAELGGDGCLRTRLAIGHHVSLRLLSDDLEYSIA